MRVAVVGATGAVGKVLLSILEERKFPVTDLVPFSSARSLGKPVAFVGKSYPSRVLEKGCFKGVDIAFFDASDEVSKAWVTEAAESGAWVIDNSATYRMDPSVPLVVPEINGELVRERLSRARAGGSLTSQERVFAGPNCSTVQLVLPLKAIHSRFGIKRVVVSTYQSTSGAGLEAMQELKSQTRDVLDGKAPHPKAFSHPIAFNCIPQIGGFKEGGYTSEELKIMQETRKILNLSHLRIHATAIRVPTLTTHGETVNVECERAFTADAAREALRAQAGVEVVDDPAHHRYPMAVECGGKDPVYVGRVRIDESVEHGLSFWVVSDNLRKGAALNAIQIGEILIAR